MSRDKREFRRAEQAGEVQIADALRLVRQRDEARRAARARPSWLTRWFKR